MIEFNERERTEKISSDKEKNRFKSIKSIRISYLKSSLYKIKNNEQIIIKLEKISDEEAKSRFVKTRRRKRKQSASAPS